MLLKFLKNTNMSGFLVENQAKKPQFITICNIKYRSEQTVKVVEQLVQEELLLSSSNPC